MARKSLADELQNLINPEPTFADPEDDENLDTSNNWIDSGERAHEVDVSTRSELRKKQVSFLSSVNKKYSGKKVSRKNMFESEDDEEDSEEDEDNEDEEEDEEDEDVDNEEDENVDDEEDEMNGFQNGHDDEEEEEEELDDEDDDQDSEELEELDDEEMMKLSKQFSSKKSIDTNNNKNNSVDDNLEIFQYDNDNQIEKANSVKNQLLMYDNLLEIRIKMQKLLQNCNRLPQTNNLLKLRRKKNSQLEELLGETIKGIRKLTTVLLEIDSMFELDSNSSRQTIKNDMKKINFDEDSLMKRFSDISKQYSDIIDHWHEKTRFVNTNVKLKKFENFEIAPAKAIQQILSDKTRLIAKTRQKRTQFEVIGQSSENGFSKTKKPKLDNDSSDNDEDNDQQATTNDEQYNEIFDDDDFYHHLLKQIIENKSGSVDDTSSASRKFVEIQRMRNKLKKVVDTRASKGRKIRFNVHEKLVNFMAPIDKTTMEDSAKDKLFKSLFGTFNANGV